MGKRDDSIFQIAEYLCDESIDVGIVHPRRYEHWEITVGVDFEGNWELLARWSLHRMPMEDAVNWLLELVDKVSDGTCKLPESITGEPPVATFKWKGKPRRKTDERKGSGRTSEQAARGADGSEGEARDLVGELPLDDEEGD